MTKPIYWKMKDGNLISIDDMSIDHLKNTLKMIVKNNNHKEEFQLKGDMANEFNDSIENYLLEEDFDTN